MARPFFVSFRLFDLSGRGWRLEIRTLHLNLNFLKGAVVSDLLAWLLRFVLKLVLGVMALVFAVSLLLVALLVVAFALVKALLTGKKPAPAMVFRRFRQHSAQDVWRRTPSAAQSSRAVVDVEVRDITPGTTPADSNDPATMRSPRIADDISDVQPKTRSHHAD